jgi:hypothetical protein
LQVCSFARIGNSEKLKAIGQLSNYNAFSADSAVKRKVMSTEQTVRSEDNAFCL